MGFAQELYGVLDERAKERGWQARFSGQAGIPQPALSKIISRQTKDPGLDSIGKIVDALGEDDLRRCIPVIRRMGGNSPVEHVEGSELPRVPVMGSTGAGEPCEFWTAEPESVIEVLPQYAKPQLVALMVEGESMEPTIKKGSVVGVVPPDGDLTEGGVYLVDVPPFGRVIKRLRIGDKDALELVSDNPAYPPKRLPIEQRERVVVGKVVWVWQNV